MLFKMVCRVPWEVVNAVSVLISSDDFSGITVRLRSRTSGYHTGKLLCLGKA